jgi:peroxiredoxin
MLDQTLTSGIFFRGEQMKRILIPLIYCIGFFIALNAQTQTSANGALAIGRPAPDFTLVDLNGKTHSLKDYRGKIVAVAFIAAECPISNDYNARMRSIAEEYAKQNVAFIGINSNITEPLAEVKAHAAKNTFDFTILKDEGNRVADLYGAERTPEIFVIDAKGALRYHGRIDNSRDVRRVTRQDLREALNELIAGKAVSVAEGKAFGCPIKRVQHASELKAAAEQAKNFEPKIGTIKPADFNKFKDAARGKVLIVNFWATWCGPCIAEFPEFVAIDAKYREKGVKMVAVSADELADVKPKVIPFVKEQRAMFDILVQDTDDPQEMIDVVDKNWQGTLPATFVYDKEGKPIYTRYGVIDRDQLIEVIEKALKR